MLPRKKSFKTYSRRKCTAVYIKCVNDPNGNARRGWLVSYAVPDYLPTHDRLGYAQIVGFVDTQNAIEVSNMFPHCTQVAEIWVTKSEWNSIMREHRIIGEYAKCNSPRKSASAATTEDTTMTAETLTTRAITHLKQRWARLIQEGRIGTISETLYIQRNLESAIQNIREGRVPTGDGYYLPIVTS